MNLFIAFGLKRLHAFATYSRDINCLVLQKLLPRIVLQLPDLIWLGAVKARTTNDNCNQDKWICERLTLHFQRQQWTCASSHQGWARRRIAEGDPW